CLILFFFYWLVSLRNLPSFPTRRSADGLSHVSFTALVIGIFFMDDPFYIAIPVVVIASVLIKWLIQITKIHADSAIGIVSSFGFAIGLILIRYTNSSMDLESLISGN